MPGDEIPSVRRRVVVKVGGSLLSRPCLADEVLRVFSSQPADGCLLLLAGGGELADAVRRYDRQWRLPAEVSHHMAVASMRATARLLAHLTGLPLTEALPDGPSSPMVLDAARWLAEFEPTAAGRRLAHAWSATSDSIAARVAEVWEAALLLLKSVDAPHRDLARLADEGIVDADFPEHAAQLDWQILDLGTREE